MKKLFVRNTTATCQLASGPLSRYLDGYAGLLAELGYGNSSGSMKVRLVGDMSLWMARKGLKITDLNEQHTATFLKARWKHQSRKSGDQASLTLLLRHLRERAVIPAPTAPRNEIDTVLRDYEHFVISERGFMPSSVAQYLRITRRFLTNCFPEERVQLRRLHEKDVTDFVMRDTAIRGRRSAQLMTVVLRSFLSYLFQEGRTPTNLAFAVPAVAGWRLSELPRYLEARQVEKLLRSCDRRRKTGKRDYAILLLLARLGLRAGEVARLRLDDINWEAGELLILGKGNRADRLPLPEDVGQALADYLRKGRPACSSRRVFVQSKAPYVGFASPPNAVCGIVSRALARAQIPTRHRGAHVLRHSLATKMLGDGASLAQIGQVLRHQQVQSTEIYAKVDLKALQALAQPWTGGVQ